MNQSRLLTCLALAAIAATLSCRGRPEEAAASRATERQKQALTSVTLIPRGATWKYLDDGSNQGSAWKEPGFVDTTWSFGPGELGYGDSDEATVTRCCLPSGTRF